MEEASNAVAQPKAAWEMTVVLMASPPRPAMISGD
jgi:hypothetical protein